MAFKLYWQHIQNDFIFDYDKVFYLKIIKILAKDRFKDI